MIVSLFEKAKQADKCASELQLLQKLERTQSHRTKRRALALITSPKGLSAIFATGLLKGLNKPSIARQLKSMAIILGKTNLDGWLKDTELQEPE